MGCGASNALDAWGLGRSSMGGKWFSTLLGAIHGDVRKQLSNKHAGCLGLAML